MKAQQFTTTEKYNPQTYLPMFEYRGYTVYRNQKGDLKKDCNYIDKFGNTVNNNIPIHSGLVLKNGVKPSSRRAYKTVNLNISNFGGDVRGDINVCDLEHTRDVIDEHILERRNNTLQKIQNRKQSRLYTYILNNVTVIVTFDNDNTYNTNIYVNNHPLRNIYLTNEFTFKDVLKQVYFNKIGNYNNYDSSFVKKNYFRDIQTFTIDLEILPIYEYIGMVVEFKNEVHTIYDVWEHNDESDFKLFTDNGNIYLDVDEIKDLKVIALESKSPMKSFTALKNKARFYE